MAAKKRHEEHENHERWLVSYADFITLLFAFFAVLYATSQADLEKQEELAESIKQQFSSARLVGAGSPFDELSTMKTSVIRQAIEQFPRPGASAEEVADHVEQRLERDMTEKGKEEGGIGVEHDTLGVRIQMAANKLFESGSAELNEGAVVSLDKIGKLLKESGRKLIIEGHTDDEPIRTGKYPSNWELSAARAVKITRYLIARHKIPASKFTPIAYADQKPLVPNTSETNRARNRRIEILIVTQK